MKLEFKDLDKDQREAAEAHFKYKFVKLIVGIVVTVIVLGLAGCPQYAVWKKGLSGKAVLREAEWSRQVKIQEAKARNESAALLAEAEVIKAKGVSEANNIMAESLGGPQGYLRWKYIEMLEETGQSSNTIVYIPTEGAMPILEAGRVQDATPTNFDIPKR